MPPLQLHFLDVCANFVQCLSHTHTNETGTGYADICRRGDFLFIYLFIFSDVYTFSPIHAPYFHVIKLFSGTNYNYALLKIIKNSRQAPQLWKNLLPACFSNLHHWFWWCLKSNDAPYNYSLPLPLPLPLPRSLIRMGCISAWGGVDEGAGGMAFSSIDRCASVWFYLHVFISIMSGGNVLLGNVYLFMCLFLYWLFIEALRKTKK